VTGLLNGASTSPRPPVTELAGFRARCAALTGDDLSAPESLHRWSVEHFREFWGTLLDWADLAWEGSADVVCVGDDVEGARFFPGVRLNYAENLLRPLPGVDDEAVALSAVHGDGGVEHLSRAALRRRVRSTAGELAAAGVGVGDRVVVIAPNNSGAVVTALALAALGAAVSTGMPDMGPTALLGRFEQVEPALLVVDRAGAPDWAGEPGDTLSTLLAGLPTVRTVLALDSGPLPERDGLVLGHLDPATEQASDAGVEWPRLPFDHPLFVMFSSGTTGPPKAMVHGAGGTLLQHVKEHRLHVDLRADDVLYFHSTTAWMMWNWQLSALATGARVVLYDGPVRGPETLWQLAAEHGVTVLGTSPPYLQMCQDAGYRPADAVDVSRLRAVLSTGAVLHEWQYHWFTDAVGPVPLQSISGGTDIIGCFVLGHPELPVRPGWCQTRGLGMDVAALDDAGEPVVGEVGELVCRTPFPSRPVFFLRDPDGHRFHDAYFAAHPGMWTHGDLVEIAAEGAARLHGRSDGVLNIDGVRIGPTEIYAVLHRVPGIADAMAVEQRHPTLPGTTRLVLLLVLDPGAALDADLAARIRASLRREASAAHVPSVILAVRDLPVTHNGKKSERAARDTLNGDPVANLNALKNPAVLDAIAAAAAAAERGGEPLAVEDGDETAVLVGRLWRETLGPAADARHTFSELGGTSRQAMTLVRQVRAALGRDLPAEAMLLDPTLPDLVAAARTAPRADDAAPVVPLAPGDPDLPPLFLVHDAWGDVDVYWPLAQLLTGTGPVLGLRTALHRPDGSRWSVPELAAKHAGAVERTAPDGPVRLAGHSFGGLVALEVATLLTRAGRTVEFVGLVDVLPPPRMLGTAERLLQAVAVRASLLVPAMRDVPLRDLVAERLHPAAVTGDRRLFAESAQVYDAHLPERYAGPVTYFRARRRIPVLHHMLRAWRRALPDLSVVDLPGAHHDVLGQAHVAEAARVWSRILGELRATRA
jgi:acetoacetyl-CoA synthetase